ncbi:MAG: DUF4349 domain-containing protein [Anaerolineae bacterium]
MIATNEQNEKRARRLAREKALYRYTSALDRGDFEAIAAVLEKAEADPALERMVLEINEAYESEAEAPPIAASTVSRGRSWLTRRRLRRQDPQGGEETMEDEPKQQDGIPTGRPHRLRNALVAGGAVVAVAFVFLVSLAAYGRWARHSPAATPPGIVRMFGLSAGRTTSDAAVPEEPVVVETVVVEKRVEAEVGDRDDSSLYYYSSATAEEVEERLIIRDGTITMVVTDPHAAHQSIEGIVAEMAGEGAYVVSSQERQTGIGPYITVRIRVPATRFDETMDRVAELAVEVTHRSESAQDVTEEYVDLEARLESLEAARERLLGLMEDAPTTEELLMAEQQLTEREATLESIKGRMQYLEQAARLASIHVELQPYPPSQPVTTTWRPAEAIRRSFEALVDTLRTAGDFLIFFAIAVLPWVIVIGLVAYAIVRLVLWRLRARKAE